MQGMAGGAAQYFPFGIPGYKEEEQKKGDGVIVDPATQLDPAIKPSGSLIYPMPDARLALELPGRVVLLKI